jgi:hypothetical protein
MLSMSRRTRKALLLGPLALLASLVPALAGTVYVPVTTGKAVGPASYTTRLWLSNPGAVDRRFTVLFLPAGTDGTQRTGAPPQAFTLAAGGTLVLTNLAPAGTSGLLEITGAPQVLTTARLDGSDALRGVSGSSYVPAISSKNLLARNGTADLLGLERSTPGPVTNLAVVNLGQAASQCTVRAARLNGTAIGDAAVVSVPPVSLRRFEDAFATLGVTAVADARLSVTCDQSFFAFAEVLNGTAPNAVVVTPTISLDSTLAPPGTPNPGGDNVVVERPGVFFVPVANASALDVPLPLVPGRAYRKATIDFDMKTAAFAPVFDSILGLLRPGLTRDDRTLYFGFNIRASRNRTFIDLGVPVLEPAIKATYAWKAQTQYHIKIVYDVQAKNMSLQALQNGQIVHTAAGGIFNLDLSDQGTGVLLKFGLPGVSDLAYYPPLGWTFANLRAQIEPL